MSSMSGPGPGPNNTPQFEEAVKQEVELLTRQYPTPDDVPGCIKLFDKAIVCNSTFFNLPLPQYISIIQLNKINTPSVPT